MSLTAVKLAIIAFTMLSAVNYRLNRLTALVPDEAHEWPIIWTVARKLLDNMQEQNGMALGGP
jgi:hypothetical protein